MRKLPFGIVIAAFALGLLAAAACGNSEDATFGTPTTPGQDGGLSDSGSPFADGGAPIIEANAIVLVHAASFPAFRICFDGARGDLPQPSVDVMPDSNVVGVDIGTAVRLPPRAGTLGRAFAFPEATLRPLYPAFGGSGPTCGDLLTATGTKNAAVDVGMVTADLSRGVHALVLGGCQAMALDPAASTERCGSEWDPMTGNLKLATLSLTAYGRPGTTRLSVQIVQLSPALDRRAAGRALGIAFGSLDAGAAPAPFIEGAVPFAQPVPNPPAVLDYAAADVGSYATSGVFVTLGGALDDAGAPIDAGGDAEAGAREVVIAQSLADIQKRSAPRSLPPDWFSFASSYVVLSVGDIDPRLGDGGPDDDPRRALHLLAIPLAAPEVRDASASSE